MRGPSRLITWLPVLAAAGLLAACAETVNGNPVGLPTGTRPSISSPTPTVPPTPTVAPTPTPAAPTAWVKVQDKRSGITFQLPATPSVKSTAAKAPDGTALVNTLYTYEDPADVRDGAVVDVTVGKFAPIRVNTSRFGAVGRKLVEEATSQGAAGARIVDSTRRTVGGHAALCYRFTFTPASPYVTSPDWLICEIAATHASVSTQVVYFPAVGQETAGLASATATQTRLLSDLHLP